MDVVTQMGIILLISTITLADISPRTIMGLESGEMLRCKYNDLTDCSTLNLQDSPVTAMAVSGEFVYVGLESGELRRCRITKPSNCTLFHEFDSEINALAISGKFIYAALDSGITKCGLRKSEDCEVYQKLDTPVHSLAVSGDHLYAGTDDKTLICSLSESSYPPNMNVNFSSDCSVSFETTSPVKQLGVFGNHIYTVLDEGIVQRCTRDNSSNDTTIECENVYKTSSSIKALDVFDEHLQISTDNGDIVRIGLEDHENMSTINKNNTVILTMFTLYATTNVKRHYVGESIDCTWQFFSCPPYIVYYDIESRAAMELKVKDGKLYTVKDQLFDTDRASFSHSGRRAIFVMDPAGKLYASNTHPIFLLHHSSLMAGNPVAAAGELTVKDGEISFISSCSGHYRPSYSLVKQLSSALVRQGYEGNVTIMDCGKIRLMIDLDYQKTEIYYKAKYEEYSLKMKELGSS